MKFPISKYTVHGNSMSPTLKEGQEVLTFNWSKVHEGDVVVIKKDGKEIVKRIDKIDGDKIYVIGDKLDESTDSRDFGPVDQSQVIGKVLYYFHGRCCPRTSSHSPTNNR